MNSCAVLLDGANVNFGIVLYLNFASFLLITLLLVYHGDVAVPCDFCTSLLLVFHGDGADLTL